MNVAAFEQLIKEHLQDQRTKKNELEKQLDLWKQKKDQQSQILRNPYSK